MRLDRFVTLNLAQPLRQAFDSRRSTLLPILMYHSISDDPETGIQPYYRVCTSPQRFREQMQWLKDGGYQAVGLSTALHRMREEVVPNGHKLVALTFDDGFLDFYTNAAPILREFGFQATMYLATGLIGGANSFKNRDCMNWKQVEELHGLGCEFGSHTINHPELVRLSWDEIANELGGAKTEIENRLGAPVKAFAYPYAFPQNKRDFVSQLKDLLMAGGYESCVTTQIGRYRPGDDLFQIKRLPVNSLDDSALLQAKLIGAYDWLAGLQGLSKALRRLRGAA